MAHVVTNERATGTTYTVRWRDGGKFRQRSFTAKRTAERFAATVENNLAEGSTTAALVKQTRTMADVVAASLAASKPRLKASTYSGYEQLYAKRILPVFGAMRITAVTSEHVEAWLADLITGGREASTVRNHFVALHKVFRYALRHRILAHDRCAAVEVPRPGNREDFAPVFLTPAQLETIAADLNEHEPYGTLVRFVAWTGLRAAEIAGLRVRDVNLTAGHVEVRQTLRKVNGAWHVDSPKSARSTRNVPLLSQRRG